MGSFSCFRIPIAAVGESETVEIVAFLPEGLAFEAPHCRTVPSI